MADTPIIRRRVVPSRRKRNGLIRFARDNTSQNGEDGIIAHLFQLMPATAHENEQEDRDRRRICVDVGAWDGRHLSNTFSLLVPSSSNEKQEGRNSDNFPTKPWRGILIEADTERFQMLESLHEPLGNHCLNVKVSCLEGSPDGLVPLLQQYNGTSNQLPVDFDFLCIDVDGSDYWLLEDVWNVGQYRPKVVCVEFNPTMPDDLIYIPSRSSGDTIRHGASLSALVELAQQYEYTLVETTLYNAFFVRKDLYQDYLMELVPDTSIEALHEVTMGTSLYQLYDGTIKLWGCKKLLWHRVPIDEAKLQVLAPELRHFPFAPSQTILGESHQAILNRAVDMSSYCRPPSQDHVTGTTSQQQQACANELVTQLKKDGFCCIRGTGMSRTLCQTALSVTNSFMQEANEDVRRSCLTKDRARRGYSPMCTENFASLIGETGPNDLVRKFRMGPPSSRSSRSEPTDASPLLRPNVWPSTDVWTPEECNAFQTILEEYYGQACSAAHAVVKALCDGLIQSRPELTSSLTALGPIEEEQGPIAHTSILTLLGYCKGARHKNTSKMANKKKRMHPLVAAHTDVGVITMLLFDGGDCAALERKDDVSCSGIQGDSVDDVSWAKVLLPSTVSDDPIFVVNIADCLSDLSHGYLPSTLHRVAADTGSVPRNCLALFVGLDPNQTLTLQGGDTMTYEEWRKQRIAKAQNVLRGNGDDTV